MRMSEVHHPSFGRRQSRRAQMKMMETFGVMVVFFFLLIAGASMYTRYQERQLREDISRANQLISIQIAQKSLFLPELKCVDEQLLCFDLIKVQEFNSNTHNNPSFRESYSRIFGNANVSVSQIYPTLEIYTLHTPANTSGYNRKSRTSVPITIHDPISRTNGFGILNVDVYLRE